MTRTTERPQVQYRDPSPVAHAITAKILDNRKTLPTALNGRPAPLATRQAAQIRKHMQQGLSAPVRHLLTVLGDDVRCGVPLPTVLSALDDMKAYLELCAGDLPPEPRDLSVLIRAETRAQGRLDMAQVTLLSRPGCAAALAEVDKASAEYQHAKNAMDRNVRVQLAVARVDAPRYEVVR